MGRMADTAVCMHCIELSCIGKSMHSYLEVPSYKQLPADEA